MYKRLLNSKNCIFESHYFILKALHTTVDYYPIEWSLLSLSFIILHNDLVPTGSKVHVGEEDYMIRPKSVCIEGHVISNDLKFFQFIHVHVHYTKL